MACSCPHCLQQSKHCTYITQNYTTAGHSNLQSTSCISNSCACSSSIRLNYIFSNSYMPDLYCHCYIYDRNISELCYKIVYWKCLEVTSFVSFPMWHRPFKFYLSFLVVSYLVWSVMYYITYFFIFVFHTDAIYQALCCVIYFFL